MPKPTLAKDNFTYTEECTVAGVYKVAHRQLGDGKVRLTVVLRLGEDPALINGEELVLDLKNVKARLELPQSWQVNVCTLGESLSASGGAELHIDIPQQELGDAIADVVRAIINWRHPY
jgi:hypothetical protein